MNESLGARFARVSTELRLLAPHVKDIHNRLVRVEKLVWMCMGAMGLLEILRACR